MVKDKNTENSYTKKKLTQAFKIVFFDYDYSLPNNFSCPALVQTQGVLVFQNTRA